MDHSYAYHIEIWSTDQCTLYSEIELEYFDEHYVALTNEELGEGNWYVGSRYGSDLPLAFGEDIIEWKHRDVAKLARLLDSCNLPLHLIGELWKNYCNKDMDLLEEAVRGLILSTNYERFNNEALELFFPVLYEASKKTGLRIEVDKYIEKLRRGDSSLVFLSDGLEYYIFDVQ